MGWSKMELIYLNTVWVIIAAAMVLLMEGGFSLLEAGLITDEKCSKFKDENFR